MAFTRTIRIVAGFALGVILAFVCVWLLVSRTGLENTSGRMSLPFVLISGIITLSILAILGSITVRRR